MKILFLIILCALCTTEVSQAQTVLQPKWTTGFMGKGVACNKAGTKILTWGENGASIWNRPENETHSVIEWRNKYYAADVSDDFSLFVVAYMDEQGRTRISTWDLESEKIIDSFSLKYKDVSCVSFNQTNEKLLVGTEGGWIIARDLKVGATLFDELIKMKGKVTQAQYAGVLSNFVVVDNQCEIKIVNSENFTTISTIDAKGSDATPQFDKEAKLLLISNRNYSAKPPFHTLFSTADGKNLSLPKELGNLDRYVHIGFNSEGNKIITLYNKADTNMVRIWNLKNAELEYVANTQCNFKSVSPLSGLRAQLNSRGDKIVVAGVNKMTEIHDMQTGGVIRIDEEHPYDHIPMFLGDTDVFLSIGINDEMIIERNAIDGKIINHRTGTTLSYYGSWALSPDEKYISLGSWSGPMKILDAKNGQLHKFLNTANAITLSAVFSKDGKTLITNSTDTIVRKWDVETGTLKSQFISGYSPKFPAFANTDRTSYLFLDETNNLLSIVYRYETNIHNTTNDKLLHKLRGHTGGNETVYTSYTSYAYTTKKKKILTGGIDNTLRIWSAESGSLLKSLQNVQNFPNPCIVYNNAEDMFASGDKTNRIYKYDINTGNVVQTFTVKGTWDTIYNIFIDLDKDNKYLISGITNVATLFDWNTGNEIWRDSFPSRITTLKFSKNSEMVAVGLYDGTIYVLRTADARRIYSLQGNMNGVLEMKFCNDDNALIAISDKKVVKKWEFSATQADENNIEGQNRVNITIANPVYNELIVFLNTSLSTPAEYSIINSMGEKVLSGALNVGTASHVISINDLSPGMYIFSTEINSEIIHRKILICR